MTANLEYAPQWPMRLIPEWHTPIIVSADGTEQRSANRPIPRWQVRYSMLMEDADKVRRLRWLLHRNLGETWRVPMWWESFKVTAEAASGNDDIEGDFEYADLVVGDRVYILNRQTGTGEFGVLDNVDTTSISLASNLSATYPVGSRVYLVLDSLLQEGQGVRRYLANGAELDLEVTVKAARSLGGSGQGFTLTEYRGLPVLDLRAFGEVFPEAHLHGDRRLDFGGAVENVLTWDVPEMRFERRYELLGRQQFQWAKLFLGTVVGKRDPFWCPTWAADFEITAGGGQGEATIDVADDPVDLIEEWFADATEPHLQLQDASGNVIYRRVQSVADVGDIRLTIDDPIDPGFTTSVLSLLQLCRLDEDAVPIDLPAPGRAYMDVAIRTLAEPHNWTDAPLAGAATARGGLIGFDGHLMYPIAGTANGDGGLVVTGGTTIEAGDGGAELLLTW